MQYFGLLGKNQNSSVIESGSTTTKIKHWAEPFFSVKIIAMNLHQLPKKDGRMEPIMEHTMHYRCMIIMRQPGYFIPSLRKKRIHLYKTSISSTHIIICQIYMTP